MINLPVDQASLITLSVQEYLLRLENLENTEANKAFREKQIQVAQRLFADVLRLHLSDDARTTTWI